MADMTNYLEQQLLSATFNGTTFSGPASIYLALFTTDPTETGTGTEVSDTAYLRQAVTFTTPSDVAGKMTVSNTNLIEFAPAAADYGTISHIGVMDADTAGNMLYQKALSTPIVAGAGVGVRVEIGDLTISLD